MSGFNDFLQSVHKPTVAKKESLQKTIDEYMAESENTQQIVAYKNKISQALSIKEKYILALELIAKLTGDQLFYEENVKCLELVSKNNSE